MNDPSNERDAAAVRFPPPLVYLIAITAGVVLHWLVPLRVPISGSTRAIGGVALAAAGFALMAGAIGLFRRIGQNPAPWTTTPEVLTSGVYRFTRNPMYVSMGLLQAAIGVGAANGWILLLVPIVLIEVYMIAIRHEEAYLERKFGATYLDYKQRVRRWL